MKYYISDFTVYRMVHSSSFGLMANDFPMAPGQTRLHLQSRRRDTLLRFESSALGHGDMLGYIRLFYRQLW